MLKKVVCNVFAVVLCWGILVSSSLAFANTPTLPSNSVFKQNIQLKNQQYRAGHSFAVKIDGRNEILILTALHLFGPSAGLSQQISSIELPNHLKFLDIEDFLNGKSYGRISKTLLLPDANTKDKDVVAFVIEKNLNITPLSISDTLPEIGESVWLVARVIGGATGSMHKATVIKVTPDTIFFTYENPNIELTATSGAPIINSMGQVIGINAGSGKLPNGKVLGSTRATACVILKPMLIQALQKNN